MSKHSQATSPQVNSPVALNDRAAAIVLRHQAQKIPHKRFVVTASQTITYQEADQRADTVANAFLALGIGVGERVAILMNNGIEYLDVWFGLSRIGGIQLPLNTAYKTPQLRHTLQRAPVSAIVVHSALLPELLPLLKELQTLKKVILVGEPVAASTLHSCVSWEAFLQLTAPIKNTFELRASLAGAIMNTSGTTGPSKGVILSHAQQYILGRNIAKDMNLQPDDVYYNFFPLFHNTAQAMITLPVLLTGCTMVLTERFSASSFWSEVKTFGCTAFYYIGEILHILLKTQPPEPIGPHRLRIGWGIGASALDFDTFQDRYQVKLRTGYGSTEANVPVFLPPNVSHDGSVGRAIEGFEIRIADHDMNPLPPLQKGEIMVRSQESCALMMGYDADPLATLTAWQDLWFHTGDAGYLDEHGGLYFVGRLKDAIRVRGENISAFEVEQVISQCEGVMEVAAIAVPCELGGDDLKIVVVMSPGVPESPEPLILEAQRLLPKFAIPRYVEFVSTLPKTETNKVRKNVLREIPFNDKTWDRLKGSDRAKPLSVSQQQKQQQQ